MSSYFLLFCWGGTNPKPEPPITTPLDSSIASGGLGGKTTGPEMKFKMVYNGFLLTEFCLLTSF